MIDAPVHDEILFFDDFQHQSLDVKSKHPFFFVLLFDLSKLNA